MTEPVPVNRPLTDAERSLLLYLAVRTIADQMPGWTHERAATALDELAERGEVHLRGDAVDVHVRVRGRDLVHATREWLSFMATASEQGDAPPAYGRPMNPPPDTEA